MLNEEVGLWIKTRKAAVIHSRDTKEFERARSTELEKASARSRCFETSTWCMLENKGTYYQTIVAAHASSLRVEGHTDN